MRHSKLVYLLSSCSDGSHLASFPLEPIRYEENVNKYIHKTEKSSKCFCNPRSVGLRIKNFTFFKIDPVTKYSYWAAPVWHRCCSPVPRDTCRRLLSVWPAGPTAAIQSGPWINKEQNWLVRNPANHHTHPHHCLTIVITSTIPILVQKLGAGRWWH